MIPYSMGRTVMAIKTTIDPDAGLITFSVTGDMTLDDTRRAVDEVVGKPGFDPAMNSLWNLKEARIAITMTELPAMLAHFSSIGDRRGTGYKVAILVRRNEDFGLSSIFEMNAPMLPFDVRVFRNTSEAMEWLGTESRAQG
jgi:hypothetical protein